MKEEAEEAARVEAAKAMDVVKERQWWGVSASSLRGSRKQ
jgi:hypothetical protein